MKMPFNIKLPKGTYGYLKSMHRYSVIKAALFLGVSVILFLCANVFFTQHRSIFIICAIISAIPAAMSVVSLIMYVRFNTGRREIFETTEALRGEVPALYDCVVTTREQSFGVNVFLCTNKNLIGYSEYKGLDAAQLTRHLEYILKREGLSGWNIKIFTEYDKYIERLKYLSGKELKVLKSDTAMAELIKGIIL